MRASRVGWLLVSTAVALYGGCGGDDSGADPAAPSAGAGGDGSSASGAAGEAGNASDAGSGGSGESGGSGQDLGGQGGTTAGAGGAADAGGAAGAGGQMEPAEVVIASDQQGPTGLALHDDFVYWANHDAGTIVRCPLTGCDGASPTEIVTGADGVRGVDVDDTSIYWISDQENDNLGRVRKCPLAGCSGEPEVLVELGSAYPHAVHVVGDVFLYGAAPNFGACPTDGCLVSGQVPFPGSPVFSMDTDSQHIYTAKYGWGEIHRCDLPDCSADSSIVLLADAVPLSVAVDETSLYFAAYDAFDFHASTQHEILKCPLAGCGGDEPELVQGGDISPYAIALSDTRLFFTNMEHGTVISIAK